MSNTEAKATELVKELQQKILAKDNLHSTATSSKSLEQRSLDVIESLLKEVQSKRSNLFSRL